MAFNPGRATPGEDAQDGLLESSNVSIPDDDLLKLNDTKKGNGTEEWINEKLVTWGPLAGCFLFGLVTGIGAVLFLMRENVEDVSQERCNGGHPGQEEILTEEAKKKFKQILKTLPRTEANRHSCTFCNVVSFMQRNQETLREVKKTSEVRRKTLLDVENKLVEADAKVERMAATIEETKKFVSASVNNFFHECRGANVNENLTNGYANLANAKKRLDGSGTDYTMNSWEKFEIGFSIFVFVAGSIFVTMKQYSGQAAVKPLTAQNGFIVLGVATPSVGFCSFSGAAPDFVRRFYEQSSHVRPLFLIAVIFFFNLANVFSVQLTHDTSESFQLVMHGVLMMEMLFVHSPKVRHADVGASALLLTCIISVSVFKLWTGFSDFFPFVNPAIWLTAHAAVVLGVLPWLVYLYRMIRR